MTRTGWLVVLWATGCGRTPPGIQPEPRPSQEPAAQAKRPPRMPEASGVAGEKVEFRDVFFSKPPLKIFSFDVTLRNPESEPRWLILPETLPYEGRRDPVPGRHDETEVHIFQIDARNRVYNGVAGNLWAIKLAPGAQITLRALKINTWWEHMPDETAIEVISARSLRFGDQPAEALVPGEALSLGDREGPIGLVGSGSRSFWHPAAGVKAPISFDEIGRRTLRAPLGRR